MDRRRMVASRKIATAVAWLAVIAASHASFGMLVHGGEPSSSPLPNSFVVVTEVVPDVLLDIRYHGTFNFVGERIDGYDAPVAILSRPAAAALARAADAARAHGFVFRIFDAYRPQAAVDHFVRWSANIADQKNKPYFYPDVDKSRLFTESFIAAKSGHSRGSTVDLTLVDRRSGQELDMGTPFDFFGGKSRHGAPNISREQAANRALLKSIMEEAGFRSYRGEWWHYALVGEPYPETYFSFPVR